VGVLYDAEEPQLVALVQNVQAVLLVMSGWLVDTWVVVNAENQSYMSKVEDHPHYAHQSVQQEMYGLLWIAGPPTLWVVIYESLTLQS
jgi:hypothetical protein